MLHMASASSAASESKPILISKAPAVAAPVLLFLRLEGLALAAISAVLYARTGSSWWLFAALWLVPDLSMLGYLVSPCWGARLYNAIHTTTYRLFWRSRPCCCIRQARCLMRSSG